MASVRASPSLSEDPSVCAPKKKQTQLPTFKVTKPGIKRGVRKLPKALQRPAPPSGKPAPVKIEADGLLNMKHTPQYLTNAVKRNSVESPLLRLDKNIRMQIWQYATGGCTIDIRARKPHIAESDDAVDAEVDPRSAYVGKVVHRGPKRQQPKLAFRLSQVCRQIYAETATLIYSRNQFSFTGEVPLMSGREDGPDGALEGWARDLLPAQLQAVTCIRPHWHDIQYYLQKSNMSKFKQFFPRLKHLRVPSRAVNCDAKWPSRGDPMRKHLRQQAKERIAHLVKEQEGDEVKAIFSTT